MRHSARQIATSLVVISAFFFVFANQARALDSSLLPTNLQVEWQTNSPVINTPYPILTWTNPLSLNSSQVKNIYVRVRRVADTRGCDENTVIEHVFTKNLAQSFACSKTTKTLFSDSLPDAFIIPPGKLENNTAYYWSIWIEDTTGKLYSSTGHTPASGGGYSSGDYFRTSFIEQGKNIYGVNVYADMQLGARGLEEGSNAARDFLGTHLNWAEIAVGPGGYVKHFFYDIDASTPGTRARWRDMLQADYERGLVPVIRLQGKWIKDSRVGKFFGYYAAPTPDADGTYQGVAQAYKRVVADLPKSGSTPLYIEIGNEMNLDWENWGYGQNVDLSEPNHHYRSDPSRAAREYAKFFQAVASAINSLGDPRIKVVVGGLGRAGDLEFLRLLLAQSGFAQAAVADGIWSTHIYPLGSVGDEVYECNPGCGGSPLAYKYQLAELAKAGVNVAPLRVLITEGGYRADNPSQEPERATRTLDLFDLFRHDGVRVEGASLFALDHPYDASQQAGAEVNPANKYPNYFWVEYDTQVQDNGWPATRFPVFDALSNTANPGATIPTKPGGRVIGYTIAEYKELVDQASSPSIRTTLFPTSLDYTFSDLSPGKKIIFVKYFFANGKTAQNQAVIEYRPKTGPTPTPILKPTPASTPSQGGVLPTPTPQVEACPGGVDACGNENRGNLTSCPSGWEYPGNTKWNAWCLQAAGGTKAYCYQCSASAPTPTVGIIGYAISEDAAIAALTSPQVSTTIFPISLGYSLAGASEGTHTIFVKYFYSDGRSRTESAQVIYRKGVGTTPQPTPTVECPGRIGACGNENYGNLGACNGTWSYLGNTQENAWCLQKAGGTKAYCYQCNVSGGQSVVPTPGTTQTTPTVDNSCGTSTTPAGLNCNSGYSCGSWSNSSKSCGCRKCKYETFTGNYQGKDYSGDKSLNCQQPVVVESAPCTP